MPAERLSMRKVREGLRLRHVLKLSYRKISDATGIGKTQVAEYVRRAEAADLGWPLPDGLDDTGLEQRLFPVVIEGSPRPAIDWPAIEQELAKRGVTLLLLWQEYMAAHPNGYSYTRFCELHKRWRGQLATTMRQTHLAGDKLFVTSIFYTLQGEGPYRGEPAVFVRLAKCNLNCSFCDTFFDDGDWLTIAEIDQRINQVINDHFGGEVPMWANELWGGETYPVKPREMVLVVTGGEPMLQSNLVPFLERMNQRFARTQIESNGTSSQLLPYGTTLVCSPKCSEKNGKPVKYLEPNKDVLARADCLKFVMNADPESPYSSIPDWALEWKEKTGKPVFVSPMNIYNKEPERNKTQKVSANDRSLEQRSVEDEIISFWEPGLLNMEQNKKNHEYAAKYCLENGCILNLQIHLYASLA